MKITKAELKRIIKEEIEKIFEEPNETYNRSVRKHDIAREAGARADEMTALGTHDGKTDKEAGSARGASVKEDRPHGAYVAAYNAAYNAAEDKTKERDIG